MLICTSSAFSVGGGGLWSAKGFGFCLKHRDLLASFSVSAWFAFAGSFVVACCFFILAG